VAAVSPTIITINGPLSNTPAAIELQKIAGKSKPAAPACAFCMLR